MARLLCQKSDHADRSGGKRVNENVEGGNRYLSLGISVIDGVKEPGGAKGIAKLRRELGTSF